MYMREATGKQCEATALLRDSPLRLEFTLVWRAAVESSVRCPRSLTYPALFIEAALPYPTVRPIYFYARDDGGGEYPETCARERTGSSW